MSKIWFITLLLLSVLIGACEDILEVPDISNQSVAILAPMDQASLSDSLVTLSWEDLAEAEAYQVQLATPDFENAAQILLDSTIVLDTTFLGTQVYKTLINGEYQWRVRAFNSDYSTPFSGASFTVSIAEN